MSKPRVISLLPAATEIVCAIGAEDYLVARSHECDFPASVRALPACTSSRISSAAPSADIERQTQTLLQSSTPLYQLDADLMRRLRPDVIITQAQCDVCAVSLAEVEKLVSQWPGNRPRIVTLAPAKLADIWDDFRRVAEALDLAEHGREVLRGLKNRVVLIIEKACMLQNRPSVACIEWTDPLMVAGNWVPELVDLAGGRNVAGISGKHSPFIAWEEFRQLDPDMIILMPCGFDISRTRAEMKSLTQMPEWPKLRAVKSGKVFVSDGNQFFNRPGPRIVESLEILAELCHPDRFNFGHRGKNWEKL